MAIDLKKLRAQKHILARDVVALVRKQFPKYDKTVQSKCENGNLNGVRLQLAAEKAIIEKFAPELKRKSDGHRLTCRISCRLETDEYNALMKNIKAEGYATTQAWLTYIVRQYNKRKEQDNDNG